MVKKITKMIIITQYLNDYGKTYNLSEISSLLKKPHQSVKPYVEQLIREHVLVKNKRKRMLDYKLNLRENKAYDYLVIAEKEKLLERLEDDTLLKVLFDRTAPSFSKCTFVIFGSFAKGFNAEDIDLLVIGKNNIKNIVENFEETYNKKIHLIQVKNIDELNIALAREIYKKHLILNNTETVVRWFGELYEKNKLV